MKKIAFFDLDYTLFTESSSLKFVQFTTKKRGKAVKADILEELQSAREAFHKDKLSYEQITEKVVSLCAACLKERNTKDVELEIQEFTKLYREHFYIYARPVLELLHKNGFEIVIVTSTIEPLARGLVEMLPHIDQIVGSKLEIQGKTYTGKIKTVVNSGLKKIVFSDNIKGVAYTLGFGDSPGDLEMLENCDYGFMINNHKFKLEPISKKNIIVVDPINAKKELMQHLTKLLK